MSGDIIYSWEATCSDCGWTYLAHHIRTADFRADLHAATTGHATDVDQAE